MSTITDKEMNRMFDGVVAVIFGEEFLSHIKDKTSLEVKKETIDGITNVLIRDLMPVVSGDLEVVKILLKQLGERYGKEIEGAVCALIGISSIHDLDELD